MFSACVSIVFYLVFIYSTQGCLVSESAILKLLINSKYSPQYPVAQHTLLCENNPDDYYKGSISIRKVSAAIWSSINMVRSASSDQIYHGLCTWLLVHQSAADMKKVLVQLPSL
jgi:hypothetical protein